MFLSHCEGNRTIDDALLLFANIESKRALNSPIPVFTSDNWDAFETALIQTYGSVEQPIYKGRGRPPLPVWIPFEDLMYAQVCKKRENGRIIEVVQKVVLGDKDEVFKRLGVDKNGCINTSYVERFHLTIRNSMARFVRKGMNFSKDQEIHTYALDLFQAWYNLIKPHKSLRIKQQMGNRKWIHRTPMMTEGRTDHIWTMRELLSFRIPIHP